MNSKFLLFILLLSIIGACRNKPKDEREEYWKWHSQQVIESIINHKLMMPDSIKVMRPDSTEIDKFMNGPLKIFYCVDLSCSACLSKFGFWNHFKSQIKEKYDYDLPVLAVVTAEQYCSDVDSTLTKLWMHEWIFDGDADFSFINNLEDDRFQAILVDENDTIRLVGNPVYNPALKELYEEAITSYIKE